jgi:hypothetical protein
VGTNEIIQQIKKLPLQKQILILEKTLKTIREQELGTKMKTAANTLIMDYKMNPGLTEFTVLDSEQFYETR